MVQAIKRPLRILFFRSAVVRRTLALLGGLRLAKSGARVGHIGFYKGAKAFGPVQAEEALLLASIIRVTRPRTLVEFGFSQGHSAMNALENMEADAHLFSYDIAESAQDIAHRAFSTEPRLTYLHKSQTEFEASDLQGRMIDFCFIDAAHEFDLNQQTWSAILPCLSPTAVIAVHDTGVWKKAHFSDMQTGYAANSPDSWLDDETFQPHRGEREFINWVCQQGGWNVVHLHTTSTLRHGVTLMQRSMILPTSRVKSDAPKSVKARTTKARVSS